MKLLNLAIFFSISSFPHRTINSIPTVALNAVTPINSIQIAPAEVDKSENVTENSVTENPDDAETITRRPVKLNMRQGLLMNQVVAVYALGEESNQLCKNHSKELNIGLRALEPWALKSKYIFYKKVMAKLTLCVLVFDSSSKLQAGILDGNLFEFGAFQQCLHIYKDSRYGPIRGKFCSLKIIPDVQLLKKILEFRNISSKVRFY